MITNSIFVIFLSANTGYFLKSFNVNMTNSDFLPTDGAWLHPRSLSNRLFPVNDDDTFDGTAFVISTSIRTVRSPFMRRIVHAIVNGTVRIRTDGNRSIHLSSLYTTGKENSQEIRKESISSRKTDYFIMPSNQTPSSPRSVPSHHNLKHSAKNSEGLVREYSVGKIMDGFGRFLYLK